MLAEAQLYEPPGYGKDSRSNRSRSGASDEQGFKCRVLRWKLLFRTKSHGQIRSVMGQMKQCSKEQGYCNISSFGGERLWLGQVMQEGERGRCSHAYCAPPSYELAPSLSTASNLVSSVGGDTRAGIYAIQGARGATVHNSGLPRASESNQKFEGWAQRKEAMTVRW